MRKAKIIFFSGAGISAESGISTFREADGLWENHKIEDVCSEQTWQTNFELVHEFYNQRRVQLGTVKPNEAHKMVSRIQKKYPSDTIIITQNVDNLFEQAGCSDVLHVHGELTKMDCKSCGYIWEIGYKEFKPNEDVCPKCASEFVKPYIVFFGGAAPKYQDMALAFDDADNGNSIIVVIGTMGNVVAIENILLYSDAKKVLNNLESSAYIHDGIFNEVYYEEAMKASLKIEKYIEENFS